MSLFRRSAASLRAIGPLASLAKLYTVGVDHWFDFRYQTDTCAVSELGPLTIRSGHKENGTLYRPIRIVPLRRFFAAVRPRLPQDSVLVDFGSGRGRVLLLAAEFGFKEARGIEFAHELCVSSRRNCERYQARTGTATRFATLEMDATKYEIQPDENFFMFCNPFDDSILKVVLENIARSLAQAPRPAWLAYYNPKWDGEIQKQPAFRLVEALSFLGHHRINLYAHEPALKS